MLILNRKNIVAFRETSPSHFDSPSLDGSYEKWHGSTRAHYNYLKVFVVEILTSNIFIICALLFRCFVAYAQHNDWDDTLYYCRKISNLSNSEVSQTPENLAAEKILRAWGPNSGVGTIRVFKSGLSVSVSLFSFLCIKCNCFFFLVRYIAPFYKLKYGHCGGHDRIQIIDCVHYCSNSPPMWAPVWKEVRGSCPSLCILVNFDTPA